MGTVNIHEAKTQLSRLIDKMAKGESFIIAKMGKPVLPDNDYIACWLRAGNVDGQYRYCPSTLSFYNLPIAPIAEISANSSYPYSRIASPAGGRRPATLRVVAGIKRVR